MWILHVWRNHGYTWLLKLELKQQESRSRLVLNTIQLATLSRLTYCKMATWCHLPYYIHSCMVNVATASLECCQNAGKILLSWYTSDFVIILCKKVRFISQWKCRNTRNNTHYIFFMFWQWDFWDFKQKLNLFNPYLYTILLLFLSLSQNEQRSYSIPLYVIIEHTHSIQLLFCIRGHETWKAS